jgi:DNA polymerase III delta prime subunit
VFDLGRSFRTFLRSSKTGRWINYHSRWLVAILVLLILMILIGCALIRLPNPAPDVRSLFEDVDRSLLAALVLAVAAFFLFNFWTAHWATRTLRRVAKRSPEELFPHSPEAGLGEKAVGRDQLVAELADSVRSEEIGPQIVVGGSGSGKTTLLLALASHLGKKGRVVPIVLNLRDETNDLEKYDFNELAARRFADLIDSAAKDEAEVDKLWRWMCKHRRIVVLADDLDRNSQVNYRDTYRARIRLALDAARRRRLPLVVTTRASGLPPNLSELPINLTDFPLKDVGEAVDFVLKRGGKRDDDADARPLVELNIRAGNLLENAFYLTLLVRLLRAEKLRLPKAGGKHAVCLGLLDADRKLRAEEGVFDGAEKKHQEQTLRSIEDLAAFWLVPRVGPGFQARWNGPIRDGERLGLLSIDEQRHPQFTHEVLHAYYASGAIARGAAWKGKLNERPNGARVQLTLILAAARTAALPSKDGFCREACKRLLADLPGLAADQRLQRAAAAAELARAGSFFDCDRKIAEACLRSKAGAGSVAKRAALSQLATLGSDQAVEALWEYAHDAHYGTRWHAVEFLVQRCSAGTSERGEKIRHPVNGPAYRVIASEIEDALKEGEELLSRRARSVDDRHPKVILLKQLAWMLPALRAVVTEPDLSEEINGYLERLLQLEKSNAMAQRGLEASIAQGFKVAARLRPKGEFDPEAEEMLRKRAVFWYSQLNLLHALALRMARGSAGETAPISELMGDVRRRERMRTYGWSNGAAITGDLHPMVRYAAKLCEKALANKDPEKRWEKMTSVVWKDEGLVVSRRPVDLDPAAVQLVGDITVLLNLNEAGSPDRRGDFGEETTLPHCLSSRHRREFWKGCPEDCRFRLCPLQPNPQLWAHRELSRAFCRDQSLSAKKRAAGGWGSGVTRRALPDFWRRLGEQARF